MDFIPEIRRRIAEATNEGRTPARWKIGIDTWMQIESQLFTVVSITKKASDTGIDNPEVRTLGGVPMTIVSEPKNLFELETIDG